MECFDSVYVPCPRCRTMCKFQSKAGDCCLREYRLKNIPPAIAGDLDGDTCECYQCGQKFSLRTKCFVSVIPEMGEDYEIS